MTESDDIAFILGLGQPVQYAERDLPDRRRAMVFPLTYGRARIGVGPADGLSFDDIW